MSQKWKSAQWTISVMNLQCRAAVKMSDFDDSQLDSYNQKSKSRKSSTSTPSINQVCMRLCAVHCECTVMLPCLE